MNILLASPFQRKLQGQYFYIRAFKSLGHSVDTFWYNQVMGFTLQPTNRLAIKIAPFINNIHLRSIVKKSPPDIFLYNTGADVLSESTIKYIKSTGCKTTLFCGDSPKDLLNTSYEKKYLKHFDAVFVSDEKHKKEWRSLGAKKVFNLPIFGIDPDFHKPSSINSTVVSDVCFVGSLFKDRQKSLVGIIKALPESVSVKIWGQIYKDAPLDPFLEPYYKGLAWEKKFIDIFSNASISLNFLPKHMGSGGNMRTFEIPACGSVQLVDKIDASWYLKNKEVVVFSTPSDAAKKIIKLLKDKKKRNSIASAGLIRTLKDHTYADRFEKYLQIVESL